MNMKTFINNSLQHAYCNGFITKIEMVHKSKAVVTLTRRRRIKSADKVAKEQKLINKAIKLVEQSCLLLKINVDDLKSRSRLREHTAPRHVVAYLLRLKFNERLTLNQMAPIIGYREHCDFIHGCGAAKRLLDVKDDLATNIFDTIKHLYDKEAI
jgi:chromosomal replication initiation ATPase DnaA